MSLRIALAQLDFLVGDVPGNATRMVAAARQACASLSPDIVVFPELALSGYPPEDLLFHRGFRRKVDAGLESLRSEVTGVAVIAGYPEYGGAEIYNAAAYIADGTLLANYRKMELPNYRVFDEKRYFTGGSQATVVECKGFRVGLLICEDIWEGAAARCARDAGAELLVVINASPYELHKQREREKIARDRVLDVRLPLLYLHMVGGQDELIFDGNSFVMDAAANVVQRAPAFEECTLLVEFNRDAQSVAVPVAGLDRARAQR